ncbi:TfoX/Sxy family protein [Halorarius litoreus]|uniref:TfoX/Sxy family protein n=1 Tax=Halorarius litoreus TaxID=2962676 RepID=UPI0020CFE4ED|nr:TfoX/Sxy family protein [Halorarius litoreus]
MQYFDETRAGDLRDAFERLVLDWPDVAARPMFGCPSYQADGTLFAVLVTDGVALTRLPDDRRDALDAAFETGPFQAGERTVTKWVQVAVDATELDALVPYVESSYEAARAE